MQTRNLAFTFTVTFTVTFSVTSTFSVTFIFTFTVTFIFYRLISVSLLLFLPVMLPLPLPLVSPLPLPYLLLLPLLLSLPLLSFSIADDYEAHSERALGDPEHHLANPVNAFLLVKRFTTDWDNIVQNLIRSNNSEGKIASLSLCTVYTHGYFAQVDSAKHVISGL